MTVRRIFVLILTLASMSAAAAETGGAHVRVTMRMHVFVQLFMAIWMMGTTAGALLISLASLRHRSVVGVVAIGLPVAGFALMGFSFRYEARKLEQILREICAVIPGQVDT